MTTYEAIQAALEALNRVILTGETTSPDIYRIERIQWQLREIQSNYRAPK